jgi:hypothetical protein
MMVEPVCHKRRCKHLLGTVGDEDNGQRIVCTAFPDGIPDDIVRGQDLHMEPREGDHGIQYERKVKEAAQ